MTVATQAPARQSSSVPSPGANMVMASKAWSKKPAAAPRLACQHRDGRTHGKTVGCFLQAAKGVGLMEAWPLNSPLVQGTSYCYI